MDAFFHAAETIAAKFHATIPTGHDDQVIGDIFMLKHVHNDHPGTAFPIVAF